MFEKEHNWWKEDYFQGKEGVENTKKIGAMQIPGATPITLPGITDPKRIPSVPEEELLEEEPILEIPNSEDIIETPDSKDIIETPDSKDIIETPDSEDIIETPKSIEPSNEEESTEEEEEEEEEIDEELIWSQIQTYNTSLHMISLLIMTTMMDYYCTNVERCRLIRSLHPKRYKNCEELPDTWPLRILMNIVVLKTIYYFRDLSYEAYSDSKIPANARRVWGSEFALLAALLKFINLVCEKSIVDTIEDDK